LEDRSVRALSDEQIDDLLAGRGAGYALAAELNHYPGPTHVLEMADELGLSPAQEEMVRDIFAPMQTEAQAFGRDLVDLESRLDAAFGSRSITAPLLNELTNEIALIEGELRAVHLAAHLELQDVLTPEQVQLYDELRGYSPPDGDQGGPEHSGGTRNH
jgi:Spy/CpxP family protein refolding chaperone